MEQSPFQPLPAPPHVAPSAPPPAPQITFKSVPTPLYSESLNAGYVYVVLRANAMGTTNETFPGTVGVDGYFGVNP